ncbi:MAG: cation:proton antiporter [Eubacteriales bacterium]|nr:cation:proton antiporter [Eubacteriales bacterium]
MLISIGLILIIGFGLYGVFVKLRLPGLLGLLLAGILLGRHAFDLIDPSLLAISADLREIALIVILVRAGLSLDLKDLRKVGRPAILMSFVPATFEIAGVLLLAPLLLGVTLAQAAVIGTMLAAVSPAVIVPAMLKLMQQGYGQKKRVPQLVMAGATADDIYALVLFSSSLALLQGGSFQLLTLLNIPLAALTGIIGGLATAFMLHQVFLRLHMRDTVKVLLILAAAFLLVGTESLAARFFPFSGLLAVMALGITFLRLRGEVARRISGKFSKIWVAAELILFVLLGAAVDVRYLLSAGLAAAAVIAGALLIRSLGTIISLSGTDFNNREKLFCNIAYLPKATVQAAVGAIPLTLGLPGGQLILSIAVLSILLTAPLGAIAIEKTSARLLAGDR